MSDIKKSAQNLSNMGRYGDTELVHLNESEKKLIERYRGAPLSTNPRTGLKEGFLVTTAVIMGTLAAAKAYGKWRAKRKAAKDKKAMSDLKHASQMKALDQQTRIGAQEAEGMRQLRQQAATGADTSDALRKSSTPAVQQGQEMQSLALGQITRQGLEGSIIASETSAKIGAGTRQKIAEQARQIALQNQQVKTQAEARLNEAMFKRGELLNQIAAKKTAVETGQELAGMQQKAEFAQANWGAAIDAVGVAETVVSGQSGQFEIG
jgi:hypothetical protein